MDKSAIRHAATIIVVRDIETKPRILMGQRGAKAAFMPNKFVFPGGAVDQADGNVSLATGLNSQCHARLCEMAEDISPTAVAVAAIRELWEETGLILGQPASWTKPPEEWTDFAARGYVPSAQHLSYFFRAVTPPGRPRRFDARFFITDAKHLVGDADDFSGASDELSHLQWVSLDDVRSLPLPFITTVVLGEIAGLREIAPPKTVPFFKNEDERSLFIRLGGSSKSYENDH